MTQETIQEISKHWATVAITLGFMFFVYKMITKA